MSYNYPAEPSIGRRIEGRTSAQTARPPVVAHSPSSSSTSQRLSRPTDRERPGSRPRSRSRSRDRSRSRNRSRSPPRSSYRRGRDDRTDMDVDRERNERDRGYEARGGGRRRASGRSLDDRPDVGNSRQVDIGFGSRARRENQMSPRSYRADRAERRRSRSPQEAARPAPVNTTASHPSLAALVGNKSPQACKPRHRDDIAAFCQRPHDENYPDFDNYRPPPGFDNHRSASQASSHHSNAATIPSMNGRDRAGSDTVDDDIRDFRDLNGRQQAPNRYLYQSGAGPVAGPSNEVRDSRRLRRESSSQAPSISPNVSSAGSTFPPPQSIALVPRPSFLPPARPPSTVNFPRPSTTANGKGKGRESLIAEDSRSTNVDVQAVDLPRLVLEIDKLQSRLSSTQTAIALATKELSLPTGAPTPSTFERHLQRSTSDRLAQLQSERQHLLAGLSAKEDAYSVASAAATAASRRTEEKLVAMEKGREKDRERMESLDKLVRDLAEGLERERERERAEREDERNEFKKAMLEERRIIQARSMEEVRKVEEEVHERLKSLESLKIPTAREILRSLEKPLGALIDFRLAPLNAKLADLINQAQNDLPTQAIQNYISQSVADLVAQHAKVTTEELSAELKELIEDNLDERMQLLHEKRENGAEPDASELAVVAKLNSLRHNTSDSVSFTSPSSSFAIPLFPPSLDLVASALTSTGSDDLWQPSGDPIRPFSYRGKSRTVEETLWWVLRKTNMNKEKKLKEGRGKVEGGQ